MYRLLACTLLSCLFITQAFTSDALSDGEHILIYDDGLFDSIADAAKKDLKDDLKKRKFKWSSKSNKDATWKDVDAALEKDVLKKKPNMVVLSFGVFDACDPKKMTSKDYNAEDITAAIKRVVTTLKAANIRVVLATPGLAGEELDAEHQKSIDAVAEIIRAYAKSQNIKICDIRKKSTAWVSANPPAKAGRLQLSKKGGKWDKEGIALLTGTFQSAIGLSKSGIQRALRWDERVIFANSLPGWQASIEKEFEPELRAAGPQEAPKGFFNPSVKGPTYVHSAITDIERNDFESDRVSTQKPTVLFTYPFDRILKHTQYPAEPINGALEQMGEYVANADFPGFIMTPLWYNEDGEQKLGKKGKRYERCKKIAEMTRAAAAKHGAPIIDLFAICEAMHAENNDIVFYGVSAKDPKELSITKEGKLLMKNEMKRALGILKEEE